MCKLEDTPVIEKKTLTQPVSQTTSKRPIYIHMYIHSKHPEPPLLHFLLLLLLLVTFSTPWHPPHMSTGFRQGWRHRGRLTTTLHGPTGDAAQTNSSIKTLTQQQLRIVITQIGLLKHLLGCRHGISWHSGSVSLLRLSWSSLLHRWRAARDEVWAAIGAEVWAEGGLREAVRAVGSLSSPSGSARSQTTFCISS